jgi:hypothetical protein
MPVVSSKQWGLMGAIRSGQAHAGGLTPQKAKEFMDATPPATRNRFARAQAAKRKRSKGKPAMSAHLRAFGGME